MLIATQSQVRVSAAFLVTVFFLGACGDGAPAPDEAELAAGRDTVDAMTREHSRDTTAPSPAVDIAPTREVISDPRMPYAESGDQLVYGHFAAPADVVEPLPAVILIHEWWGLNDNVRAMANRLAGEGYMVLAVDLYKGEVAASREAARVLMLEVVEGRGDAEENIRSAHAFLQTAGAPRIASLGWCFGGGWSLITAQLFPDELDATVIYYGQLTDDEEKLRPVSAPILGLFGAADTGISVASVEGFRAALERLDKDHEIHIYPGVGHAFANPSGENYDAEAATDAWQKTLEFLDRHLSPGDAG